MQEPVQLRKLNRDSSHDKGGTLHGFARRCSATSPGLPRDQPSGARPPGTPA